VPRLSDGDRTFIVSVVREVLTAKAPEEVAIYAATSDDILRHVSSARGPDADSDAFFGGLEQTLGEILTHAMALIAVEFLKHGWTLSRSRLVEYLKERRANPPQPPPTPPIAQAESEILEVVSGEGTGLAEPSSETN
jgi:hypothetical protein